MLAPLGADRGPDWMISGLTRDVHEGFDLPNGLILKILRREQLGFWKADEKIHDKCDMTNTPERACGDTSPVKALLSQTHMLAFFPS